MGDFTNWKPKPLFEIIDYTESLEPQFDKHYVINMMMFENVLDHTKDQTYKFEDDDWPTFRRYSSIFYEEHAKLHWKQIIQKHLMYKKPHLVNAAYTREDFHRNLFFMAANFKVGKHEYIVRAPAKTYDSLTNDY